MHTQSKELISEKLFIELPRTTLHYLKTGSGPPLIIVPALISRIDRWKTLSEFIGQNFTTYFFELPGHGESTPYPKRFQTHYVPETVEAFVDALGIDRFTLMGFSFGGILSLRTLDHLRHRIDQLILLSPAISKRALLFSRKKRIFLKILFGFLKNNYLQQYFIYMMHNDKFIEKVISFLGKFTSIDEKILSQIDLKTFPISTLDVLTASMNELLRLEFDSDNKPYSIPCFFGMSIYDDLLDYGITSDIVKGLFTNVHIEQFYLPYHQPPTPFTYDDFESEYGHFLENIQDYTIK